MDGSRHTRIVALLLVAGFVCVFGQEAIRLKTRSIDPQRERGKIAGRHLILQFAERPGPSVVAELARRHIRMLAALSGSALMVGVDDESQLEGLDITWVGPLDPADKISPLLQDDAGEVYLAVFHPDVGTGEARAIVEELGLQVLENASLASTDWIVTGHRERLVELARSDGVAYILPARPELALRRRLYRCPGPMLSGGAVADYVLTGQGWSQDTSGGVALGYFFENLTSKLDANTVRSAVERAFAQWALYGNVSFTPAQHDRAARSIDILFASGVHGDAYPFSGTGILAHTFYPAPPNAEPVAGDMHFNADEDWASSGLDLFSVALHETGHALGLGHSDNPDAVMYPYYRQASGLSGDDIAAIQALYGSPSAKPVSPPLTPPVTPPVMPPPTAPVSPPTGGAPGAGADATPPAITITSPSSTIVSTQAASLAIAGTAADNVGVTVVKWSTSTGASGTAAGTTSWSADVPLLVGNNVVTVRAYDAAGNSGWRAITVVRQ